MRIVMTESKLPEVTTNGQGNQLREGNMKLSEGDSVTV